MTTDSRAIRFSFTIWIGNALLRCCQANLVRDELAFMDRSHHPYLLVEHHGVRALSIQFPTPEESFMKSKAGKTTPAKTKSSKANKATPDNKKPQKVSNKTHKAAAVAVSAVALELVTKTKPKRVRGSFSMPRSDYDLIASLKSNAIKQGRPVKKNELLRAGLRVLIALHEDDLRAALAAVQSDKSAVAKRK